MGGRGRGLVRGRRVSLLPGGKGWDRQARMMRANWGNKKLGERGLGWLACCVDVYMGGIFSASIFLGFRAGGKVGIVPFDFLLGFGIFYLSTCVSDIERFFFELERYGWGGV